MTFVFKVIKKEKILRRNRKNGCNKRHPSFVLNLSSRGPVQNGFDKWISPISTPVEPDLKTETHPSEKGAIRRGKEI